MNKGDELSTPTGRELMNAMIAKMGIIESTIRANTEQIGHISDLKEILQEVGKRASAEEKRLGELDERVGALDTSLRQLTEKLSLPIDAVSGLRADLEKYVDFFRKPHLKEVHYRHFLGAPVLSLFACALIIVALVVLLFQARGVRDEYIENDLQWRYLELSPDIALQKILDSAGKRYQANPEQFRKDVVDEEQRLRRLAEKQQVVEQTQEDIRKLEGMKKPDR
jgi:hypothetical protein